MYNKITIILLSILILFNSATKHKVIYVANVGEDWKEKIDSAINLIKQTDMDKYNQLIDNCDTIDFSYANFSTTVPPKTIVITNRDMKLNSINNLAAVLVHESHHLYFFEKDAILTENEEELECYMYEYDFLTKLSTQESWLFSNCINKIIFYQNKIKK